MLMYATYEAGLFVCKIVTNGDLTDCVSTAKGINTSLGMTALR